MQTPLTFKMTSRTTVIASMVAIILTASASSAWAAHTPEQLQNAGYICFNAGPLDLLVCLRERHLGNPAVPIKVFTPDGSEFLGTELLLREDVYAGQPCPQDGLETWDDLRPGFTILWVSPF